MRAELDAFDAMAVRPNATPSIYLNVHNGIHPHLRLYLLGMIDTRLARGSGPCNTP